MAPQQFLNMLRVALQLQAPLLPTRSTSQISPFLLVCVIASGDSRLHSILSFKSSTPSPRQPPRCHQRARTVQLQHSDSRRPLEFLWSLGTQVLVEFHTRALPRAGPHRASRTKTVQNVKRDIERSLAEAAQERRRHAVTSKEHDLKFLS